MLLALIDFYRNCTNLGCVRVLKDSANNSGVLSLVAPTKDKQNHSKLWYDEQNKFSQIIPRIKKYCWISVFLATKNIKKIINFVHKVKDTTELKYSLTSFNRLKISDKKGKSIKIKLFSFNF